MNRDTRINIVGGGIGGLTCALALRHYGFSVTLFEQSASFSDVGAGITLGPNASRVLIALGLLPALEPQVRTPRHAGIMHFRSGENLSYKLRGERYIDEFGSPFWHIHRADLLDVLVDAISNDEGIKVRTGHKLQGISETDGIVTTRFENGDEYESDVLIASDGLKSFVRDAIFETQEPEFTGYVAWRGLVERKLLPDLKIDPDFALYVGPQRMFGRYAVRQRSLINYVAIAIKPGWAGEGWSVKSEPGGVLSEFADWCDDVVNIIEKTPVDGSYKWALHVREPLQSWVKGRVTLLGDAAHPMTPFLGLGAGMTIEDALVLARAFDASENCDEALSRYETARLEHANMAQTESAKQGLHLLNNKPGGDGGDKRLYGEDSLGLYQYDATTVSV